MTDRAFTRNLADDALAAAGITTPPVDLDDVAQARALRIERNAQLEPGARAAYREVDGLISVISLSPRIERFSVAHELGHALLGDGGGSCTEYMITIQTEAVSLADAVESFNPEATASAIAGHLLLPSRWLRRAVAAGRTVEELLELFDVTRSVLLIALQRDRLLMRVAITRTGTSE